MRESNDFVAEGAVSGEPFSGGQFPVPPGKNREIRRFGASLTTTHPSKHRVSLAFLVKFPMQSNREFFEQNKES
jgi:hypothetical protein